MTSGYVLTREGDAALDAFTDARVRFAAALSDGSGIVAFDGAAEDLDKIGTVFLAQEHPEGADPTQPLPDWYKRMAPKRGVANGREHFTLAAIAFEEYAHSLEAVTGCVRVTDELLLIESDGPIAAGAGWTASVVSYLDKRLSSVERRVSVDA